MAKIRFFAKLSKELFPDAPSWFDPAYDIINQLITGVQQALQNRLTFAENFNAEVIVRSVVHGVPQTFKLSKMKSAPKMVLTGYASGYVVTGCSITTMIGSTEVQVTTLFNGAPSGEVQTTFTFIGD